MSRLRAELAIRVFGIACLAALWVSALTQPDDDPTFKHKVLAIATVGMAAAQQPWVAWLRRAGLAVVLWLPCIVVTAGLSVAVDFLPFPRGASVATAWRVLMGIGLGEAAHHSEIAFCGLAKDRYPMTPEEECVWEQAALDG